MRPKNERLEYKYGNAALGQYMELLSSRIKGFYCWLYSSFHHVFGQCGNCHYVFHVWGYGSQLTIFNIVKDLSLIGRNTAFFCKNAAIFPSGHVTPGSIKHLTRAPLFMKLFKRSEFRRIFIRETFHHYIFFKITPCSYAALHT